MELYAFQQGHREAGGAAALSRGKWYVYAVAVVFLEGATEKLAGRRLLVVVRYRGCLLRRGRLNGVGFLLYASLHSGFSRCEGPSELGLGIGGWWWLELNGENSAIF